METNTFFMIFLILGLFLVFLVAVVPVIKPIIEDTLTVLQGHDDKAIVLRVLIMLFIFVSLLLLTFLVLSIFQTQPSEINTLPVDVPTARVTP